MAFSERITRVDFGHFESAPVGDPYGVWAWVRVHSKDQVQEQRMSKFEGNRIKTRGVRALPKPSKTVNIQGVGGERQRKYIDVVSQTAHQSFGWTPGVRWCDSGAPTLAFSQNLSVPTELEVADFNGGLRFWLRGIGWPATGCDHLVT